ncbi:MAG: FAD-dependent oxidoreductase [Proteobacteria bacterium]|nr:FAD-dependent oxidoreductase [Pseudomonadota bacterium]
MTGPQQAIDCLIVGAGPAGLAAALEASRQGLSAEVYEAARPGGQALAANLVENFPGFPGGIAGRELMKSWVEHVDARGIRIVLDRVESLAKDDGLFVAAAGRREARARTAIVAVGLVPKSLSIPGERELTGRRLFSYVDPTTLVHSDKRVAIIGGGDVAFDMALGFANRAKSVMIVMRGGSPKCARPLLERAVDADIEIVSGHEVMSLSEDSYGAKMALSCGAESRQIEADIIVSCIGKEPMVDFLDRSIARGAPGLFIAGDLRHGRQCHISMAAGDGTAAVLAAAEYLKTVTRD